MDHSRRARLARAILPITALLLPPLAVFAPLGAAPLLAVTTMALILIDPRRCRQGLGAVAGLAGLLALLGIWASLSALWSIVPEHSLFEGARFLLLSAGGLATLGAALTARQAERQRIGDAVTVGVGLALILLVIERFAGAPITRHWLGAPPEQYVFARFDRGVTVLALALWPAAFAEDGGRRRGALMIAIAAMTVVMASATAMLAALLSLAVFAAARVAPRLVAGAMIVGTLALSAAVPLAMPSYEKVLALHQSAPWIKWSGIHRLLIWRFVDDRVTERPFLGWGMDASRAIPGGKTDFNTILPDLHYPGGAEALPLHPHDAALQLQLELGLPGLLLGVATILWILWQIGWRAALSPGCRAGGLALAAASLTVGMLSFGVWQAWWLSTLWLIAAFYSAVASDEHGR